MMDELRRLGFIEGQNLTIDDRNFAQHVDLISEYAAELVKAKPDVIYGGGGVAVRALQQATRTIPIAGAADDCEHCGRGQQHVLLVRLRMIEASRAPPSL